LSMIDASVVDLPEPVGPVTRMRPRGQQRSEIRQHFVDIHADQSGRDVTMPGQFAIENRLE